MNRPEASIGMSTERRHYRVEVGHVSVQVEASSPHEALQDARRWFCVDMPRFWDVIQALDADRFRVLLLS